MANRRQRRSAAQATSQSALNAFKSSALPQSFNPTDEMPEPSAQEVSFAMRMFENLRIVSHPSKLTVLQEWCEYFHEIRGWTKEKTIVVAVANVVSLVVVSPPTTLTVETRHFTPFQGVGQTLSVDVEQLNLECMD